MNSKLFVIYVVLLVLLCFRIASVYTSDEAYQDKEEVSFEAVLTSEPTVSGQNQRFSVITPKGRVLITTGRFPAYHYGDKVLVQGSVKGGKAGSAIYFPTIARQKQSNFFLAIVSSIRQRIISSFEQTLPPNSASLLLGIVFGLKSLEKSFLEELRATGTLHVVAASGMNVMLLAGFLYSLCSRFLRRHIAGVATILGICFYAVLSGLEPSIIRASIMGSLVYIAQLLGRQSWPLYGLLMAGYAMVILDPRMLEDVGFQLSFAATAGLILLASRVQKNISWLGENIQTTFVAQIATLPILLFHFGSYSILSVPVNALVLWTIAPLMTLGAVASVLVFFFEPLAKLFLFLSLPLLIYFETVIHTFGKGVQLEIPPLPWQFVIAYYLFITAFLWRKKLKK